MNGIFHSNIEIEIHSKIIKQNNNGHLLAIHVLTSNKGRVPVDISNKEAFILEIKKIENQEQNRWIDPNKLKLINKINLLDDISGNKKSDTLITFEPDSSDDQVKSIILPNGTYWIHARLDIDKLNEDGDYFEGVEIVKIPNE